MGIGCFWFEPPNLLGFADLDRITPQGFIEEIENALKGVDSITNIEVNGDRDALGFIPATDSDDPDHPELIPIPADLLISFDIFIPERLQDKYIPTWAVEGREKFHVDWVFRLGMPIVYITFNIDEKIEEDVGSARPVAFVREHLEAKLANNKNLSFKCLGPSPFHTHFVVKEGANDQEEICLEELYGGPGYSRIRVLTPKSSFPQIRYVVEGLHETFSAYYSLIRLRDLSSQNTRQILDQALSLLDESNERGPVEAFRRRVRQGPEINAITQTVIREKIGQVEFETLLRKFREEKAIGEGTPLARNFSEFTERADYLPWSDIADVIKLLEQRRQKFFTNVSSMLAGIVGGLTGAIIGSLATYALAAPSILQSMEPPPEMITPKQLGNPERGDSETLAAPSNAATNDEQ